MDELFSGQQSEIPDALWRAQSPVQRQLAAVQFWAETTKIGAAPTKTARLRKMLAHPNARERIMAALMGTAGATGSLLESRTIKTDKPVDVGGKVTDTPTKEQMNLRVDRAALAEQNAQGTAGKITNAKQSLKERAAQLRAENKLLTAALAGAVTGGAGYAFARKMKG